MIEFYAKAIINAPVAKVWQILINSSHYPKFDPFCIKIEGNISLGSSISIVSKFKPERSFRVRIVEMVPEDKMVWQSGTPFNLFKGVRTFTLIAKDDETSEIHLKEVFSGILLPLIKPRLPDMTESFKAFTYGLKKWAERE